MRVRVRYAPSPTGLQHIGGVRTALFNYFFARSQSGTFILRIEDTDRERYDERAIHDIYETFDWLGIGWDEGPRIGGPYGPYFQSERTALYREHAEKLLRTGRGYRCFCTQERLDRLREDQAARGAGQGYDRQCRNLDPVEGAGRAARGERHVVRLKIPFEGSTAFEDRLIGRIERANADVNPDPVLLKSDGYPTYHLANVIDDHYMEVTHILRAQEWIPSGPLHVLLYEAFGWTPPEYCHLPMVMGQDGQKLSKRHGSTSLVEFRNEGYLPEAIINYLSLLGWAYDDQRQLFSKTELEQLFSIEKLNKASAVFDYKKLEWYNGHYIRETTSEDLVDRILPFLSAADLVGNPPTPEERDLAAQAMPIVRERLRLLKDAPEVMAFLFRDPPPYDRDLLIPKKADAGQALNWLQAASPLAEAAGTRSVKETEEAFRSLAEGLDTKLGNLMMPIRVALTGTTVSPPLIESLRLLPPATVRSRLARAQQLLQSAK